MGPYIYFHTQFVVICWFFELWTKHSSNQYTVRKWRGISNNLFRYNGGCFLVFYPNSRSGRFLKLSCNVISNNLTMNFSYILLPFDPICIWVDFSLMHDYVTSYTGYKNSLIISSKCWYISLYLIETSNSLVSPSISSLKSLNIRSSQLYGR